jgi:YidC/Oxa1 family membrane protein insertase
MHGIIMSMKEIKVLGYISHLSNHSKLVARNIHLRTFCCLATSSTRLTRQLPVWAPSNNSHSMFSALGQHSFIRFSSTVDAAAAAVTSSGVNPMLEASTVSIDAADISVSSVSSVVEPTLHSLGLASFTPSGLVQAGLEHLHVGLDVPWWTAIVIGTICVRLAIFPLVILAQRNAAQMHNHMPTMQRLQERMSVARMSGDPAEAMRASNELMQYMQRNGVNPFKNLLVPLAQMPIFISVFIGVREMASLPVVSMQSGGILWFTDLTVPDPFYALPLITMATLLATVEVGVDGVKAGEMSNTIKFVLRAMPFFLFPFIIKFPAAMLCYWFTSNAFSLVQVLFLKLPGMKEYFKIPQLINHGTASPVRDRNIPKKGFIESFRETMTNMRIAAEIEERQRLNALRMKESQRMSSLSKAQLLQPKQQIHSTVTRPSTSKSTTDSTTK